MAKYEITFLFNRDEKEPKKAAQALFKAGKIKVVKVDDWKVKELAYPINKQTEAYYLYFEVEAEEKYLPELNKKIKLEERILRSLIVKIK